MIYEDYYINSELNRWVVERDVPWDDIDLEVAHSQPELLAQIRDSCLIESFHPVSTKVLMDLLWDDIDATSVLSIELFEGFRHFYTLKRYLDLIEYDPPITQDELVELRRVAMGKQEGEPSVTQELINFAFSEHFAAYYFTRVMQRAKCPVLKQLALNIAKDEFRHTNISYDLLKLRLEQEKESVEEVLKAAANFKHYGTQALDEVPAFMGGDLSAIQAFVKKVDILTGHRLVDYLKENIPQKS